MSRPRACRVCGSERVAVVVAEPLLVITTRQVLAGGAGLCVVCEPLVEYVQGYVAEWERVVVRRHVEPWIVPPR